NPEGRLKPGAFATALVTVGTRENRPVAPEEALVATRSGYQIYLVEDGRAHARPVQTGLRRDGLVEITDGLAAGEVIVQSGHMRVNAGSPVNMLDAENSGTPDADAPSSDRESVRSENAEATSSGGSP